MYSVDKKSGRITINGWEKGAAASPHKGIGDVRCVDITTIPGEASVNYSRLMQTNVAVVSGVFTAIGTNDVLTYPGVELKNGTWILITSISGAAGFTNGNYYFVIQDGAGNYQLSATFNGSPITPSTSGTITFNTLNFGTPVDYAVEQTTTYNAYRYYILDANGQAWVSGAAGTPAMAGALSTTTVWSALFPSGTSAGSTGANPGGIAIIYGTTSGAITYTYLFTFSDGSGSGVNGIQWLKTPSAGGALTAFAGQPNLTYFGGFSHRAFLANDGVMYWCDGPNVYCLFQQTSATPFDPATPATYSGTVAGGVVQTIPFFLNPTDAATRIAQIPSSGGVGIVVGGQQNNLYFYPSARFTASGLLGQPSNVLWMPESNTQYLLSTNNFVIIFCGSKGNIYLTTGSVVVPILTVPDYIAGAVNFEQEPYFTWGGAAYIRGRIFFSIQDQTASHTGNCGGIWSFVPTFGYFPQQDTGAGLRVEAHSAVGNGYNGYAPVIFAGQDTSAQLAQGPQYIAAWNQGSGGTTSIDFSNTTPYTDGSASIDSDAIPVGTFTDKKTYSKVEYKLAALPSSGDSVALNYRTSLNSAWTSAGTIQTEGLSLSGYCPVNFQNVQLIQIQVVLTAASSNSSFVRLEEIYIHPD